MAGWSHTWRGAGAVAKGRKAATKNASCSGTCVPGSEFLVAGQTNPCVAEDSEVRFFRAKAVIWLGRLSSEVLRRKGLMLWMIGLRSHSWS